MMSTTQANSKEAVFRLVVEALSDTANDKSQLTAIFRQAMGSPYGKDSASLHNLGVLAAKAGLKKEALAFALDHFDEPQYYSAFVISKTFLSESGKSDGDGFERLLSDLERVGHFETKKYLLRRRFHMIGPFKWFLSFIYSLWLLPSVFRTVKQNPTDPKLDRRPGVMRTS